MISKQKAISILNAGLETGADFAEIFIEDKIARSIVVENGKVDRSAIGRTYGAGVRLFKDLQSVYGYTNEVTVKSLTNLITSLSNAGLSFSRWMSGSVILCSLMSLPKPFPDMLSG